MTFKHHSITLCPHGLCTIREPVFICVDEFIHACLTCTGFTTRAHIVRAMLEAICYQTRDVLDAMRADADLDHMTLLRVDGGATQNDVLMQLQVQ